MPRDRLNAVLNYIRELTDDGPSDRQLLERFAKARDEDAFAWLIRRHGPLVLGVCRRLLRHEQDTEDVFQATFLVLARRTGAIRKRESLGSWLYGVALRLALQARAEAARRHVQQREVMDVPVHDPFPEFIWHDLRQVLDEEIGRLPRKYRDAFVLCHLQGKTNPQAAQELGCPVGTVLSRIARARELLRLRLVRRGISLTTGLMGAVLAEKSVLAAVPAVYFEKTMKAAMVFAADKGAAAGVVSAHAAILAEGVLHTMYTLSIRMVAAVLLVAGMIGTAVYSTQPQATKSADQDKVSDKRDDREDLNLSRVEKKAFQDPEKEKMRLANALLKEEIEDEKAKLEALHKKLDRLKKSGIKGQHEDAEMAALKRENRRLQQEFKRMQEDVQLAEEEVQPYVQALQQGAGKERRAWGQYKDKSPDYGSKAAK